MQVEKEELKSWTLGCTVLELYKDNLYDLLVDPSSGSSKRGPLMRTVSSLFGGSNNKDNNPPARWKGTQLQSKVSWRRLQAVKRNTAQHAINEQKTLSA